MALRLAQGLRAVAVAATLALATRHDARGAAVANLPPQSPPAAGQLAAPHQTEPVQIAALTLKSISDARHGLAAGLTGIGREDSSDIAGEILSWLFMVPSLDCADLSNEATVCLLTPAFEGDIPDRAAVLPVSPFGGEARLRESLKEAYGTVVGTNVLFCTQAADNGLPPEVCVVVTSNTALVASSRESLRWVARRFRAGALPRIAPVREGCILSATFDGPLSRNVVRQLLPAGSAAADGPLLALSLFGDVLATVSSLDVSVDAGMRAWRAACRLHYPGGGGAALQSATAPDDSFMDIFPPGSFCRSASALPALAPLLPETVRALYAGESPQANFCGFHIFPALPDCDRDFRRFLAGDRAAAYVVAAADGLVGRIEAFSLKQPAEAAKWLDTTFGTGAGKGRIASLETREANGRKIHSYHLGLETLVGEDDDDFLAVVISLLAGFNSVEVTVDGDRLLVASGSKGMVDGWLRHGTRRPEGAADGARTVASLTASLGALPPGETSLGGGEVQPSAALAALAACYRELARLSRRLPRYGDGFVWRLSRFDGGVVFDVTASSTELMALIQLDSLDRRELSQLIVGRILQSSTP